MLQGDFKGDFSIKNNFTVSDGCCGIYLYPNATYSYF